MKVRATQLGYYNHVRRREGDVFTLVEMKDADGNQISAEDQFSQRWMEPVDDDTPERVSTSQEQIKRQTAELRGGGEALHDDPRPTNRPHTRHDAGMTQSTKEEARQDAKDAKHQQEQQRSERQGGKSTGDRDAI